MADKKIIWSNSAKNELRRILEFYNERNGSEKYSLKILNETEVLMNYLEAEPSRYQAEKNLL